MKPTFCCTIQETEASWSISAEHGLSLSPAAVVPVSLRLRYSTVTWKQTYTIHLVNANDGCSFQTRVNNGVPQYTGLFLDSSPYTCCLLETFFRNIAVLNYTDDTTNPEGTELLVKLHACLKDIKD